MLGAIREGVRVVGVAVRDVLQTLLCPLMAKLGSQNLHISLSALRTLREVWLGCGLPSLSRMVSDNCDYLLSAVSLWLMDPSQMSVGLSVYLVQVNDTHQTHGSIAKQEGINVGSMEAKYACVMWYSIIWYVV